MKVRVPQYYDVFTCIGSSCPDTCCVGWMIEIDEKSYQRFKCQEGEFGQRIRDNIIERSDGHFFALNEKGRCAFLNKDNLCEMVIKMGDEGLCSLCDNYPRIGEEFGELRELGLSISCPEVARLILSSSKPIKFGEWELDESSDATDYTKDIVFNLLLELRDVVFAIMQNRNLSIMHRASIYVILAANLQNVIDEGENVSEKIEGLISNFSNDDYIQKLISSVKEADFEDVHENVKSIFDFISNLEVINEKWIGLFNTAKEYVNDVSNTEYENDHINFHKYFESNNYVYEHLMVYYVYRYFMKMIFDGDIYSKAVMCVVALITTMEMNIAEFRKNKSFTLDDEIKIMYLFSKEIEHCEENMQRLANEFWDNDIYETKSVIDMLTKIL